MKPFVGIQLVKSGPVKAVAGRPVASLASRRVTDGGRSVDSKEVGREDSAPKSFVVADAEAISLAEGRIWATANARLLRAAGVPSPGHAFTGILQELGNTSQPPAV